MTKPSPGLLELGCCAWFAAAASLAAEDPPLWSGVLEVGGLASAAGTSHPDDGREAVGEALAEARIYWQPLLGIRLGLGAAADGHDYQGGPESVRAEGWYMRLPATIMLDEHIGFTSLSSAGESRAVGVPASSGHQWQVEAGLLYVRDADFYCALTAVVTSRFGLRPSIFPLPSLAWTISPVWSLTVVDEIDDMSRLTRTLTAHWACSLLVDARFFEYRLPGNGGQPAVLADERAIIGIEGKWRPWGSDALIVRPYIGDAVYRMLTLRSADGQTLSTTRVSPTLSAGMTLYAAF
jgi:hypothetical protein